MVLVIAVDAEPVAEAVGLGTDEGIPEGLTTAEEGPTLAEDWGFTGTEDGFTGVEPALPGRPLLPGTEDPGAGAPEFEDAGPVGLTWLAEDPGTEEPGTTEEAADDPPPMLLPRVETPLNGAEDVEAPEPDWPAEPDGATEPDWAAEPDWTADPDGAAEPD